MKTEKRKFSKKMNQPDERREFRDHGHLDVLSFDDGTVVGRGVFEPGWRWSNDVKPIAETESYQASHIGYCFKGQMTIRMDNGEEFRIEAGDAYQIPAGHDAWVEGNDSCEMIDFGGFAEYAVKKDSKKTA